MRSRNGRSQKESLEIEKSLTWAIGIVGNTVPLQGTVIGSSPILSTKVLACSIKAVCRTVNAKGVGSIPTVPAKYVTSEELGPPA